MLRFIFQIIVNFKKEKQIKNNMLEISSKSFFMVKINVDMKVGYRNLNIFNMNFFASMIELLSLSIINKC
ncbi:CLUMA_CG020196, isoform A [Clunio marinus]|uniref:CLUMA_CG020196, isoform A n=1 Tax=Clunio marinus TaxID=568069 RepID=A0A1J1J490_9DIPT|nr:CLUMA_CG020196, isoform A [Clunio marinus]